MNHNSTQFIPIQLEMVMNHEKPCNHTRLRLSKESSTFYVCKDCGKEVERKVFIND